MAFFRHISIYPIDNKVDRLSTYVQGTHFRDALSAKISLPDMTPAELQHAIFAYMPQWVTKLMWLRNRIVQLLGVELQGEGMAPKNSELAVGDSAGFLVVKEKYCDEIISFAEDKHMTFYLSVAKRQQLVVISTLVNQKTLFGKLYVAAIRPFHYVVARAVISSAVKGKRI
ncbi:DUF2867 domain-containing protein [Gilvimarinus sp. SDUM040013]|uniref:DUF2867 domain-containing protein n=1 Tax=Gilvimarinus gilvus TaxID=3058038 RepID=A0ABU4S2W6_9GAMM|nr:DUF2867 domain-containing protein [Gilvimarinus sp. SDUM040013]MDO3385657.1 DUF2867 domain-containing protein [Gilvimarinus sp. SDUM040013]MDX6851515.1 DUF2867 domain-containing protein [Gilvimarinus sp. SDUM040013]